MSQSIITFLSDFGLSDSYVAQMKAFALKECPTATLIDITHLIPAGDILAGSITLWQAIRSFPAGTFHVAVVDPGVGSDRKLLLAEINQQIVLLPDNGLITWAAFNFKQARIHELIWRPDTKSYTFHGRDILAPIAAMLAAGNRTIKQITGPVIPILLDTMPANVLDQAQIIHIDHYGNCSTNVYAKLLTEDSTVDGIGAISRTYSDVADGTPVAIINSSGLLEIAVRNGSAASALGLKVGSKIKIV